MPLSSINTGLQEVPDLTDIQSVGKLSFQFISLYNAIGVLQQAIDTYTGNTPAAANQSNQNSTPEQTILVGNTCNMWCKASGNISAGFLVNMYNVGGVTTVQLADAAPTVTPAHGLSITSASSGNPIQVLLFGLFNFGGSVTPGALYYLSALVAGGLTTSAPSTAGDLIQVVGFGVDTDSLFLNVDLNNSTVP